MLYNGTFKIVLDAASICFMKATYVNAFVNASLSCLTTFYSAIRLRIVQVYSCYRPVHGKSSTTDQQGTYTQRGGWSPLLQLASRMVVNLVTTFYQFGDWSVVKNPAFRHHVWNHYWPQHSPELFIYKMATVTTLATML